MSHEGEIRTPQFPVNLTPLMRDFSFRQEREEIPLTKLAERINTSPEQMSWQLHRVSLQDYSLFFITCSEPNLLKEIGFAVTPGENPQISLIRTNRRGRTIEKIHLGNVKTEEQNWGASYHLQRKVGVPFITAEGDVHDLFPSPEKYFLIGFPCLVQAFKGPVFQMAISCSEKRLNIYSPEPFFLGPQIWGHLKGKEDFRDVLDCINR